MKYPIKAVSKPLKAMLFSAICATSICSLDALAAPIKIQWNPSLTFHASDYKPFPARSMYQQTGGADTSDLISGSALSTVGLSNDSSDNYAFNFGDTPNAFSLDHYLNFSLTPGAGYQADLDRLNLATDRYHANPTDYILRTSLDGFVQDIVGESWFGPNTQGYAGISFDLTPLQALTEETQFHLHISDSNQNDGYTPIYNSIHTLGYGLWFGGIEVSEYSAPTVPGNTATVPEPSGLLLIALGGLVMTTFRRRTQLD